jgi:transaldolase/glucose-6-phosphate isomerase
MMLSAAADAGQYGSAIRAGAAATEDAMGSSALNRAHELGTSLWLDYISRRLLAEGGLRQLMEQDDVLGVTSNPIIFGKAISQDPLYDAQLRDASPDSDPEQVTFEVMVQDVRDAADLLMPSYEAAGHQDGFVSLEVSPHLAHSYAGTMAAARSLWTKVDRPNLLIKIPATAEGIAAFEDCLNEGIGVNVTVIFSLETYVAVAEAYVRAMQRRQAAGLSLDVAAFESVFVGRLDPPIDALIEEKVDGTADPERRRRLEALRGRGALANAERIHERFRQLEAEFPADLRAAGCRLLPIIWASVGARDETPATKYVDGLIAPGTVITMPEATMEAFRVRRDLGRSMGESIADAHSVWSALRAEGVNPDRIAAAMEEAVLDLFSEAFDGMVGEIQRKLST